jgi:hypothetical protein
VDGKTIVDDTIKGLINAGLLKEEDQKDIVDTWLYHAGYSYPTPTVERDGILSEVIPYLERNDIYSRGRFGMWKYEVANTDHTLMQGVELVNRLLLGEPETTIGIKYESTLDGRNAASHDERKQPAAPAVAAVHQRPHVAGSGDPKRMASLAAAAKAAAALPVKISPDAAAKGVKHPGRETRPTAGQVVGGLKAAQPPARGGPGDKAGEPHAAEEELGITATDAQRSS